MVGVKNNVGGGKPIDYETKVSACADYLLGKPLDVIAYKHGISKNLVTKWIRQRKCFKMRSEYVPSKETSS